MADLTRSSRPRAYRQIGLADVDRAIKRWFDQTVDAHVMDVNGQRRKARVVFAAGERWASGRDPKGARDKDGRLILPIMTIRRTGLSPIEGMSALGTNVPRLQISRVVSSRTDEIQNAMSNRSIASRRLTASTVYEVSTIPFPFVGTATYELTISAQYITHVNQLVEKVLSELEFYDVPTFTAVLGGESVEGPVRDGEGSTEMQPAEDSEYGTREPIDEYYVCGYFDGDFSDIGNSEEFTEQERVVKTSASFRVPVYLHLDPEGKRPPVKVEQTAAEIEIGDETVCVVDDLDELDRIFGIR